MPCIGIVGDVVLDVPKYSCHVTIYKEANL